MTVAGDLSPGVRDHLGPASRRDARIPPRDQSQDIVLQGFMRPSRGSAFEKLHRFSDRQSSRQG
jgi:hypothetical protein